MVFLAVEKSKKHEVALKLLKKRQLEEENLSSQVRHEITIQSSIKHPNILKLYGCFHDENNIYLILEYAPNGTLRREILRQPDKHLNEKTAAGCIKSLVSAITYLHQRKVIHRHINIRSSQLTGL